MIVAVSYEDTFLGTVFKFIFENVMLFNESYFAEDAKVLDRAWWLPKESFMG